MELLDVVDSDNNLTGEKIDREIIHSTGLFHREVGVIIINEKNEILLEKRSPTKKQSPNKWGLVAGHIDAGETPDNTMIREIKEEIGIDVSIEDLEFLKIVKRIVKYNEKQYNNNFFYTYLLKTKKRISDYTIQKEELTEVKYFKIEEIENAARIKDENFVFSKEEFIIDILNIVKNKIKEE